MRNFIQPGNNVTVPVPVPAPAAVDSGDGVLVGSLFGVATGDAAAGDSVVICTTGCYLLPKLSTDAIAQGAAVYWDDAAKQVTATDTGYQIGHAIASAANPSNSITVRLSI